MMEPEAEAVGNLIRENPFMNDLILDNVFQKCSRDMITNCRLVNRKWYSGSLPVWNNGRSPIKISCERKPDWIHHHLVSFPMEPSPQTYLSDFVQDFHNVSDELSSEINGMSGYKAFSLTLSGSLDNPEIPLNTFWSRNGPWITNLKIEYRGLLDVPFLRHIFSCDYTPTLQELELNLSVIPLTGDETEDLREGRVAAQLFEEGIRSTPLKSLKISEVGGHLLIDWQIYLRSCPKLEKLDLGECNSMSETNLDKILRVIKEIRDEDQTKLRLKSLRWWNTRSYAKEFLPTVCKLLKESKLDLLESLSFAFQRDAPSNNFHELCTMHSQTLKELSFYKRAPPLQASPFAGVPMDHLVSLVVEGMGFANLLFLKELSVLRSLKLKGGPWVARWNTIISATKEEDMGGLSLPSLSSFCCEYYGDFQPKDLSRLAAWMPALLRMELRLSNESFRAVCGLWPNLQHVTIYGGRIGDRGIVGRQLKNGRITFTKPNITNLQNLRSFVVKPAYEHRQILHKISPNSVKHGLSKLRRLEEVTIAKMSNR